MQINGVTVDPSNYTTEEGSTIVTLPIEYLKTLGVDSYELTVVSESKSVKGGFTVKAPELNAHRFYYNQPYSGEMDGLLYIFVFREDGTIDIMWEGNGSVEVAKFIISDNNLSVEFFDNVFSASVSEDGKSVTLNELNITFAISGDEIVADKEYLYIYNDSLGGYEVKVLDNKRSSYGPIRNNINNRPTKGIYWYGFIDCENLTSIAIPDSITSIGSDAFHGCAKLESINIPNSVTSLGEGAFFGCTNLATAIIGDGVSDIGSNVFYDCTNLKYLTIGSGIASIADNAFYSLRSLTAITYDGTVEEWNAITKGISWNLFVPATEVVCSDGTVSLV